MSPTASSGMALRIRTDRSQPVYLQICARFRAAITAGQLPAGARVPSIRALASELGVARGTVEAAYELLTGEGWLLPRGPAGTVVAPSLTGSGRPAGAMSRVPERMREAHLPASGAPRRLQMGLPALDAFPRGAWARIGLRHLRAAAPEAMTYPDARGLPRLREAIASYLQVSRGVTCTAEEVFVTSGYRATLGLVARVLLTPSDTVWIEDPGYPVTRTVLGATGTHLHPVAVDAEGMRVADATAAAGRARLAVVTPGHQSPLGVPLALPRRMALLHWAAEAAGWIVEDDYDGEFHYAGRPLPALKSLDREARVLYAGTFSKVLHPGLRLAYLVVPPSLSGAFAEAINLVHNGSSHLEQAIVADFLVSGQFARHLRRMRALYAARRALLVDALTAAFGTWLRFDPQAGGMHLLARLHAHENDRPLALGAQAAGFGLQALSTWGNPHYRDRGLLMGFTNVRTAAEAAGTARDLQGLWKDVARARP